MQKSNASSSDETVYLWWVPLTYTADFQTVGSTWLAESQSSKEHELSIPVDKNHSRHYTKWSDSTKRPARSF